MKSYKISDKGSVRKNNEDCVFTLDKKINILDNLFIVADGVGGNSAGEIASKLSIKYFVDSIKNNDIIDDFNNKKIKNILQSAVSRANYEILNYGLKKPKANGLCTTFVCATIKDKTLYATNIGDSRLYLLTNKVNISDNGNEVIDRSIVQITQDNAEHVERIVNNQMIKKKYLTKAIGSNLSVLGDYYEVDLERKLNDNKQIKILLCSDGLYDSLTEDDILNIAFDKSLNNKKRMKTFVKESIKKGSRDNISVVLIDLNV